MALMPVATPGELGGKPGEPVVEGGRNDAMLLEACCGRWATEGVAAANVSRGTDSTPPIRAVEPGMAFSTSCASGPMVFGEPGA